MPDVGILKILKVDHVFIMGVFSLVNSKARTSADKQRFLRTITLVNLGSGISENPVVKGLYVPFKLLEGVTIFIKLQYTIL